MKFNWQMAVIGVSSGFAVFFATTYNNWTEYGIIPALIIGNALTALIAIPMGVSYGFIFGGGKTSSKKVNPITWAIAGGSVIFIMFYELVVINMPLIVNYFLK